MSIHTVIATFNFKEEGGKNTFLDILKGEDGLVKTRKSEGCVSIDLCESLTSSKRLVIFQKWKKQSNHEAYLQMRKETGLFDLLSTLLSEPLDVQRFDLIDI